MTYTERDELRPTATDAYLQIFPALSRHSVALGRVWWWAQNWATEPIQAPKNPRPGQDIFTLVHTIFQNLRLSPKPTFVRNSMRFPVPPGSFTECFP
jgi:hypothetical protein